MKTQHFIYCLAVIAVLFTACKKDKDPEKGQVQEQNIPVTGITLNNTELTLVPGDTITLIATVEPADATNKNVTWMSSNLEVATVDDNGSVTALAEGKAIITVTTLDDNKTAMCAITVKESEFIVVTFEPGIVFSTEQGQAFGEYYTQLTFDINQDGIDDIRVWPANQSSRINEYFFYLSCNNDCFIARNNSPYIHYGDTIDEKLDWVSNAGNFLFPYRETEQFIAIKFVLDNKIHYGWISVRVAETTVSGSVGIYPYYIIEKYAYCKTPNKVITAGQVE